MTMMTYIMMMTMVFIALFSDPQGLAMMPEMLDRLIIIIDSDENRRNRLAVHKDGMAEELRRLPIV